MTTMTSIYRDPATYELLFMERRDDGRWIPCLEAMESWRTATWRLYHIIETDTYVTMPGNRQWPLLPPAEEANIDHLLAHPWIPDGAALDVNEGDLPMTDLLIQLSADDHDGPPGGGGGAVTAELAWSRTHMDPPQEAQPLLAALLQPTTVHVHHTHHHVWDLLDTVARPMLVWDNPFLLRERAPPPPLSAAALALRLLAATAAEEQQQAPKPQVAPMPKHVADLVLRDAEARGATCPISMDPIKATDAAVTSCGHVFQTEAIRHWLTSGHDTCPQCRQPCTV